MTVAMYFILMIFSIVFITTLSIVLIDGLGKILLVENLVRLLLNLFAIILFVRGLCNPEIYDRRSEPRIGCFLMQIDAVIGFSCMVLDFHDIWSMVCFGSLGLAIYTWFAIICFKWQIDDKRRNAL